LIEPVITSPTITGGICETQNVLDNSQKIASTAYVQSVKNQISTNSSNTFVSRNNITQEIDGIKSFIGQLICNTAFLNESNTNYAASLQFVKNYVEDYLINNTNTELTSTNKIATVDYLINNYAPIVNSVSTITSNIDLSYPYSNFYLVSNFGNIINLYPICTQDGILITFRTDLTNVNNRVASFVCRDINNNLSSVFIQDGVTKTQIDIPNRSYAKFLTYPIIY
jgi:hypothetical protein